MIANIERVAKVFVTKTVYATVLALAVLAGPVVPAPAPHPGVDPTIGIPGFFLKPGALHPLLPGFVRRTLTFAVPAGLAAPAGTLVAYQVADVANVPRTRPAPPPPWPWPASAVVLALAARPLNRGRGLLLAAMAAAFAVVLLVPFLRVFFALDLPPLPVAATALVLDVVLGGLLTPGRAPPAGAEGVPHPPVRAVGSSQDKASRPAQFPPSWPGRGPSAGLGFVHAAPSQAGYRAPTCPAASRSRRPPPLPAALGLGLEAHVQLSMAMRQLLMASTRRTPTTPRRTRPSRTPGCCWPGRSATSRRSSASWPTSTISSAPVRIPAGLSLIGRTC